MPAQFCATTVHVGPYSGLADAYGAMVTWIYLHSYEMDGAPYEIYVKKQPVCRSPAGAVGNEDLLPGEEITWFLDDVDKYMLVLISYKQ